MAITSNNLDQQHLGGGLTPLLKFPIRDDPAYTGRISFKTMRIKPLDINAEPIFEKTRAWDNVMNMFTRDNQSIQDPSEIVDAEEAERKKAEAEKLQKQLEDELEAKKTELARGVLSGLNRDEVQGAPRIDLYFPLAVQIDDTVDIGTGDLGSVGMGIVKGMANQDKISSALGSTIMEGAANIFNFAFGSVSGDTARYVANKTSRFGPQGIQTAVKMATQTAVNPNTRAVFNQVNLRQFSFTFKFIPASRKEAQTVQAIVKHFRTHMYPETFDVAGLPLGYKYPDLFQIKFKHRNSEAKIPRLELCYLRGVQSSYNPTGQVFFDDGQPNEIDMTLQFQEFRTLTRQDITKGY